MQNGKIDKTETYYFYESFDLGGLVHGLIFGVGSAGLPGALYLSQAVHALLIHTRPWKKKSVPSQAEN